MMSFVGGVWKLLTTSVRDECEASFEDGVVQVLYQRVPDIPYESPLSFRQTSLKTNVEVKRVQEEDTSGCGKYNEYTPEERAQIGKFAAEHGPTKAVRHFSKLLSRKVQLSIHSSASIFPLRHLNRTRSN